MITNTGKFIIAKYMLGQTPAYASYMALGCGKKPLSTSDIPDNYSDQQNLDFEMFRVPISSRGYVVENGESKLVLTAELPTEERYEISEVGIYSAGSNISAGANDSRSILAFTQSENWQHVTSSSSTDILRITEPLDGESANNIIATTSKIFETNADNKIFYNQDRASRYERCRFFNNIIAIRGDAASISVSGDHLSIASDPEYIKLTGVTLDFSKNAPSDQLRIAFSIANKDGGSLSVPDNVKLIIEFTNSADATKFSRIEVNIDNGTNIGEHDFDNNRYCVISKELQDFYTSANFSWTAVDTVNIYSTIIESGLPSNNFYLMLDALRLENVNAINPLYGLVGYSLVQNVDAETIIKSPNTSNYVEFKFSIGVG